MSKNNILITASLPENVILDLQKLKPATFTFVKSLVDLMKHSFVDETKTHILIFDLNTFLLLYKNIVDLLIFKVDMPLTFIIKSGDFNFEISSYISRLHSFFKFFDYDKDSKDELFINYLVPASLASSALVSQSKSWTDTDMENCWRQAQKTMWDHQNTELGEQPIKIEPDFELLGFIRPANRSKKTVCSTSVPTLN